MSELLSKLDENNELCEEFRFDEERIGMCYATPPCQNLHHKQSSSLCTHAFFPLHNNTIQELINGTLAEIHDCNQGGNIRKHTIVRSVVKVPSYYMMFVERQDNQFLATFNPRNTIDMYDHNWFLIAFAEFDPVNSHYRSWIKTAYYWICVSDNKFIKAVDTREMDLKKLWYQFDDILER